MGLSSDKDRKQQIDEINMLQRQIARLQRSLRKNEANNLFEDTVWRHEEHAALTLVLSIKQRKLDPLKVKFFSNEFVRQGKLSQDLKELIETYQSPEIFIDDM